MFDHLKSLGINQKRINTYLEKNYAYGCKAGTHWIGIDSLGNVSPCPLLLYKDVIIGNVFEKPLKDILDSSVIIEQL